MDAPKLSRRHLILAATLAKPLSAADGPLTARAVVDRIKSKVGVPWREQTVDNFKDGSNPDQPLTGIATTMVATYELLQRAAAAKRNLIIVHEPTFYSNLDEPKDVANDPMFRTKRDFIAANNLSVFRFHDHWHRFGSDGIITGMAESLGWTQYKIPEERSLYLLPETSLNDLALRIRDRLKVRTMRVVGDPQTKVSRAMFNPGSTGLNQVMRCFSGSGVDVLVCGEPREWDAVEYARDSIAAGKKKGLIILGHDMSEEGGMKECARWLKSIVTEVPVEFMPAGEAFWSPSA